MLSEPVIETAALIENHAAIAGEITQEPDLFIIPILAVLFPGKNKKRAVSVENLLLFSILILLSLATWLLGQPVHIAVISILCVIGGEAVLAYLDLTWEPRRLLLYLLGGLAFAMTGGMLIGVGAAETAILGMAGSITATTLRSIYYRDTWLVLLATAIAVLATKLIPLDATISEITIAAGITIPLALLAYRLEAMDESGALAGSIMALATILAGGYRWFLLLGLFVVLGSFSSKYRFDEKIEMGVARRNEKRSFSNVMANGSVALISVFGYALSTNQLMETLFILSFCASLATATADTLSSEIGTVHGDPLLITTFEKVEPGTDGGVSLIGEVVTIVAPMGIGLAGLLLGLLNPIGVVIVSIGGIIGGHMDSIFGATLEDRFLSNDSVNLLASLSGAVFTVAIYFVSIA